MVTAILVTMGSLATFIGGLPGGISGFGQAAGKVFKDIGTWINDKFIQPFKDWFDGVKESWKDFETNALAIWDAIWLYIDDNFFKPIALAITVAGDLFDAMATLFMDGLGAAWDWINDNVFTPIGNAISFVVTAFIGVGTAIISVFSTAWGYITGLFSSMWDAIPSLPDLFTIDFWTGLATGAGDALWGIGQGLVDGVKWAVNAVIGLINDLFSGINFSVAIPEFLGGGSVGIDLSSWSIPMLAKGGIVNKPTLAMIGEDGPEAVVPLSQRNNPSGAGMGGSTYNITVNAGGITDRTDKRALAREIGNMIQQELARSVGGTTMRGRY
tara:strand:+ start:255 stop:1235 length:981 start_codon:yes stop_codon:yes gene_type:complete